MGMFNNSFERRWFLIFMLCYLFIMIPFPWFYNETYVPSFYGVPLFVYCWIVYGWFVVLLIVIYAKQCLARKEYKTLLEQADKDRIEKGE